MGIVGIMLPSYTLSLRLPVGLLERIDEELKCNEFTNRTDLITAAIRFYLDYRNPKGGGER